MKKETITMDPEKLQNLKNDLQVAGYNVYRVSERRWDAVVSVGHNEGLDHNDRSNILTIFQANQIGVTGTSLVEENTSKRMSVMISNGT